MHFGGQRDKFVKTDHGPPLFPHVPFALGWIGARADFDYPGQTPRFVKKETDSISECDKSITPRLYGTDLDDGPAKDDLVGTFRVVLTTEVPGNPRLGHAVFICTLSGFLPPMGSTTRS